MSILCYPFLDIGLSHIPPYCTSNFRSPPFTPTQPPLPTPPLPDLSEWRLRIDVGLLRSEQECLYMESYTTRRA